MENKMKALACCGMGIAEGAVINGFRKAGLAIDEIQVQKLTEKAIADGDYLFVFTVNFSPDVSNLCQKLLTPYISYITEWPVIELYHLAVKNPCNFIFCFDQAICQEWEHIIPGRIFHIPLGTDVVEEQEASGEKKIEVSFVGSLCAKHRVDEEAGKLPQYAKGYLDALLGAQARLYGCNLLKEALNKDMVKDLKACLDLGVLPDGIDEIDSGMLADVWLGDMTTEKERCQLLRQLSEKFVVDIYTPDSVDVGTGLSVRGQAGTYEERLRIYRNSQVNINLTHRSVQTGIPQEVFDIMEVGGFVLTNFQPEIPEFFVIGEHLDIFSNEKELVEKTAYYLEHGEERMQIARIGQQAVREYHSYTQRAITIFNTVFSDVG